MDCSEDLVTVDMNTMTVHQMTTASILVPDAGAAPTPARGGGVGGGGGGGGAGAGDLGRRLLLAARLGDTHAVLELLARGAPFTTDWLGTSALHLAAINGHVETCAVLLRAGVSRDCRTKVDRTPLHLAAHAGHAAVAELLLEHHAAVDCRDMLQMTPLHWAVVRRAAGVARALLAAGADPRARCKFRRTPLALAAADPALLALLHHATHKAAAAPDTPPAPPAAPDVVPEASPGEPSPQPEPIKINIERPLLDGGSVGGAGGAGAAAAMLRRHGITLLPADEGSTVLNALRCGRSVVLSDAGKLMLKESGEPAAAAAAAGGGGADSAGGGSTGGGSTGSTGGGSAGSTGGGAASKGVLLTATPVRSPPRHGVKIFTLNNKLLTMPKENKAPTKKVIDPHDSMQIQYIKLPSDAKLTPSKCVPMKAKNKQGAARPAVKLMMQKANLSKLTDNGDACSAPAAEGKARSDGNVLFVPEEFLTNSSPKYLRTQLLTAHKTIASLNAELSTLKARLSKYEKI